MTAECPGSPETVTLAHLAKGQQFNFNMVFKLDIQNVPVFKD